MEYLKKTYMRHYRRRFIKCYTNQMLHFDIITTSRGESDHAVLKRQLKTSTDDFKTMVNAIKLLLINQIHEHTLAIVRAEIRFFFDLRFPILNQLVSYITIYAFRKIAEKYKKMIEFQTTLFSCSGIFIGITRLSCSHKIQNRIFNDETLMLKNVHLH